MKAVVLLSGGLDSATVLALAVARGFTPVPLSFDYGQRHLVELRAAQRICESLSVAQPTVIKLDLRPIGGSALTADMEVPKDRKDGGIPVTYVPARNTLFLSYALGQAEVVGASDIFIGVNAIDYSGYPDCRPEFIAEFEKLANLATKAGVEGTRFKVHAPLIRMTKAQIVKEAVKLGLNLGLTHSCYDPVGDKACGRCDSCRIRKQGFADAGVPDPTEYAR